MALTKKVRLLNNALIPNARWCVPVGWEPQKNIEGAELQDGHWWKGKKKVAGLVWFGDRYAYGANEVMEADLDDLRVASCGDCRVIGKVEHPSCRVIGKVEHPSSVVSLDNETTQREDSLLALERAGGLWLGTGLGNSIEICHTVGTEGEGEFGSFVVLKVKNTKDESVTIAFDASWGGTLQQIIGLLEYHGAEAEKLRKQRCQR